MAFAKTKGTPLPIVLNASDSVTSWGSTNSFGNDCIARDSATEIRLGK